MMKIGIFGGSFNPIHNGHINIAKKVKNDLNLDFLYFVPTNKTPDKIFNIEKNKPIDRFNMIKKSIDKIDKEWLKVSNFEIKLNDISFTYKTIKYFRKKYINVELYLIVGEDRYRTLSSWKNIDYIRDNSKIVVFRRSSIISEIISEDESIFINDAYFPISSTNVLKKLQWNEIPDGAKKYIAKKRLYLKTITFLILGNQRYEHSVAVASHSKRLSKEFKYKNISKAYDAGMIHDLFKLKSNEYLIEKFKKYNNIEIPPINALHGFVVADWLENEYKLNDKEFTNSLRRHTLASPKMTKLDKIIFVADKISSDRKGEKVGKLRKLAYHNLELTYIKILKQTIKKLEKRNIKPHIDTLKALEIANEKQGNYEYKIKRINKR